MNKIFERYDQQHIEHILSIDRQIKRIYQDLVNKLSGYCARYSYHDSPEQFAHLWMYNDKLKAEIDRYLSGFSQYVESTIKGYISTAWERAEAKNDTALTEIIKHSTVIYAGSKIYDLFNRERPKAESLVALKKMSFSVQALASLEDVYSAPRRLEGLTAFLKRTTGDGLNLSGRVWRLADLNRGMIEELIGNGILKGKGAPEIAVTLNQYLQFPDQFFRRVRNPETGNLELSYKAREFHPGRGVYRSSLQNARRLAITETNASYRSADHERWTNCPMVVGYTVQLSGSHPAIDCCDDLRGNYPKDFFFTGWHVQCLCHATPVLLSDNEVDRYLNRILNGSDKGIKIKSENVVKDVPEGFKQWVVDNSERAKNAKTLPYFYTDNPTYIRKIKT